MFLIILVAVSGVLATSGAFATEPEADRIMRAMGAYLQSAEEFSFHADVSYDESLSTGEKVKYGSKNDVSVQRPNRLLVSSNGDEFQRKVFYNGETMTLFDVQKNLYASSKVPGKLDDALDLMFEKFGFVVPVADFVYADPYAVFTENVDYGSVVGEHACGEKRCHHLLFTQESIDWQIWIETGPRPLPRRLVITYKEELDSHQYEAWLSRWNFQPQASQQAFNFHPPNGANRIEFLSNTVKPDDEEEDQP
jgi:hypothetical protein